MAISKKLLLGLLLILAFDFPVSAKDFLRWRDGYEDAGNLKKPDWHIVEADNGAVTAIDMNSLHWLSGGQSAYIVGYSPTDEYFRPGQLRAFTFDCHGHYTIMSGIGQSDLLYAPPRSVAGRLEAIICAKKPSKGTSLH